MYALLSLFDNLIANAPIISSPHLVTRTINSSPLYFLLLSLLPANEEPSTSQFQFMFSAYVRYGPEATRTASRKAIMMPVVVVRKTGKSKYLARIASKQRMVAREAGCVMTA